MKAKITANKNFTIGQIDERIYGSFVEHMGRCVYGGIYEPGHESADEMGFREDVRALVRQLGIPLVRYPGGNFVSGYRWEDGTGPKENRPRRLELAWKSVETNQVGIDEFQHWARTVDADILMTVNLGTRGAEDAKNLVEYCNGETDTHYANLRRQNGFEKPFGVKTWCLGNEMDGYWQIGAKSAEEYGRLAAETAKMMKWADPEIELVVCGSCGFRRPTYGKWDLTVLEHTYEHIDYISIHMFSANKTDDTARFLGRSVLMDDFIKSTAAICDTVKAMKRSKKTVNISFDEWNVWYHTLQDQENPWQEAPALLQDVYTFDDALVVGCMLMTLQNNCDRVKLACMAQLVNVLAPIMTENGGKAWVQTTFYPFLYGVRHGRGHALRTVTQCDSYKTDDGLTVPYIESVVIAGEDAVTLFAVNRSLEEDMELTLALEDFGSLKPVEHTELYCEDLKAVNTKDASPVQPKQRELPQFDGAQAQIKLKKHSWNMVRFAYQ